MIFLVEEAIKEQSGADINFAHYHFNFWRNYPFLTLTLENIHVHDPGYEKYQKELIALDKLAIQFRFWRLFYNEFRVRRIGIEGGKISLFRNSDGSYFNIDFLKRDTSSKRADAPGDHPVLAIDRIRIKDLSFLFLDSLRTKSYHFDMVDTRVLFNDKGIEGADRCEWRLVFSWPDLQV